jgi:hypothetical protein
MMHQLKAGLASQTRCRSTVGAPMRWFILIAVQCSFRAVLHQTLPQE